MTEPITLTDPDGAVTRVAPWSSWTREQTRAPGGEPALVTRLERGQLWFSAGRRKSPWRHEVQVGPATVSTPRGRFHVIAESDGGATIACLAGRTRVVTGLREPVLLGPDQSAAVSSDGRTLVVMDRDDPDDAALLGEGARELDDGSEGRGPEGEDLAPGDEGPVRGEEGSDRLAGAAAGAGLAAAGGSGGSRGSGGSGGSGGGGGAAGGPSPWYRRSSEVISVIALLGVLIAAVVVFGHDAHSSQPAAPPASSTSTASSTTTTSTSTSTSTSTTTTSTTTTTQQVTNPGTATGQLLSCRRAPGGVDAQVTVRHTSGGPGRFSVEVGVVDATNTVFARGNTTTGLLSGSATEQVTVTVRIYGAASGSCQLIAVTPA